MYHRGHLHVFSVVCLCGAFACDDNTPRCPGALGDNVLYDEILCDGTFSDPLPVFHITSPTPSRVGTTVRYDYLMLGPDAERVETEVCKWGIITGPEDGRLYPCTDDESEPWATLGRQGTFERVIDEPPQPVPAHCADRSMWRIGSWAAEPLPRYECTTYNAWRFKITSSTSSSAIETNLYAVRSDEQPDYPPLASSLWELSFEEANDGTFIIGADLELPEDTIYYSRSQTPDGRGGPAGMIHLLVEHGAVVTPADFTMQVPDDRGHVSSRLVLAEPPDEPVRMRVLMSASRPWPSGETISYVVEVYWDAAARAWSHRTLLPFDP